MLFTRLVYWSIFRWSAVSRSANKGRKCSPWNSLPSMKQQAHQVNAMRASPWQTPRADWDMSFTWIFSKPNPRGSERARRRISSISTGCSDQHVTLHLDSNGWLLQTKDSLSLRQSDNHARFHIGKKGVLLGFVESMISSTKTTFFLILWSRSLPRPSPFLSLWWR